MNFEPLKHQGRLLGWQSQVGMQHFFFGSKHCDHQALLDFFPHYDFHYLKQVHGNKVVLAKDTEQRAEADGFWTAELNQALVIQTADCVPILIGSSNFVCALHAGWRGVEAQILEQGLRQWKRHSGDSAIHIAFGPHIRRESFEVGLDVAERLLKSSSAPGDEVLFAHRDPQKRYVHLEAILLHQLQASGVTVNRHYVHPQSTTDNPDLHSYRQSGGQAGRQLSFVVLRQKA